MLGFPLWETFVARGMRLWGWASTPWLEERLAWFGALLPPVFCLPHPVLPISAFTHPSLHPLLTFLTPVPPQLLLQCLDPPRSLCTLRAPFSPTLVLLPCPLSGISWPALAPTSYPKGPHP